MPEVPPPGRLQEAFDNVDFSEHGSRWDDLWRESFTPWDRGGPSVALADVLSERQDLFPQPKPAKRQTALVPGCGKGHDVLLLAGFGYDVCGLDYSALATKEAVENERAIRDDEVYRLRQGVAEKGKVTWATGDFFTDAWLNEAGVEGKFDLIFDYTFLCALPLSARPAWAKRMASLLALDGRLVCLEFPTYKPISQPGPPWGVEPETYVGLLSRPGTDVSYDGDGKVVLEKKTPSVDGGLKRLELLKPRRTHQAGYDEDGGITDNISVWAR